MTKGERLRKLREDKGLSQVEAAEKIGVSKQTLYKYEKDIVTNIPSDIIEKMASLYDSSPAYLMGWQEQVRQLGLLGKELEQKTRPITEKMKIISDQLSSLYGISPTDHNKETNELLDKYSEEELSRALSFAKAFLKATPEQQKIALEILQLHRESS